MNTLPFRRTCCSIFPCTPSTSGELDKAASSMASICLEVPAGLDSLFLSNARKSVSEIIGMPGRIFLRVARKARSSETRRSFVPRRRAASALDGADFSQFPLGHLISAAREEGPGFGAGMTLVGHATKIHMHAAVARTRLTLKWRFSKLSPVLLMSSPIAAVLTTVMIGHRGKLTRAEGS
jgi:hypothetical protein